MRIVTRTTLSLLLLNFLTQAAHADLICVGSCLVDTESNPIAPIWVGLEPDPDGGPDRRIPAFALVARRWIEPQPGELA